MTTSAVAGRELKLDADPESVRKARHFVRSNLCELGFPESVEDGELIVSELVTNSVLWAPQQPCLVIVRVGGGHPVIEVHDGSSELPKRCEPDFVAEHGRGLHLVDALCAQWECVRSGNGKAVIVRLPSRKEEKVTRK
jgi:anti-sigma regulatory factor (Ser/Thr protein kinase)